MAGDSRESFIKTHSHIKVQIEMPAAAKRAPRPYSQEFPPIPAVIKPSQKPPIYQRPWRGLPGLYVCEIGICLRIDLAQAAEFVQEHHALGASREQYRHQCQKRRPGAQAGWACRHMHPKDCRGGPPELPAAIGEEQRRSRSVRETSTAHICISRGRTGRMSQTPISQISDKDKGTACRLWYRNQEQLMRACRGAELFFLRRPLVLLDLGLRTGVPVTSKQVLLETRHRLLSSFSAAVIEC